MSLHEPDDVTVSDVVKVIGVVILATVFWIAFLS